MNIGLGIGIPFAKSQIWLSLFDPSKLFTAGVDGVWYDPSDLTTLYRDAAGTQPVTAVEQPVGLMLDKSKGISVSATDALAGNGNFDTPAYWSDANGVSTITGSQLVFNGSATLGGKYCILSVVVGKYYEVSFDVVSISQGGIKVWVGVTQPVYTATTPGTHRYRVACTGDTIVRVYNNGTATAAVVDNVVVKEVFGNHAFNSSGNSANFPVLSARVNLLERTEDFTNAYWSKNAAVAVTQSGVIGTISVPNTIGAGVNIFFRQSLSTVINTTSRIEVRGPVGVSIALADDFGTTAAAFTGDWQTITLNTTGNGGFHQFYIRTVTANQAYSFEIRYPDFRVANDALNQPAYQRVNTATDYDTVGFKPYVRFNGVSQWLQTNSIDFSYSDKMFVCAGVRKLSDAALGMLAELSVNSTTNDGSIYLAAPRTATTADYQFSSRGTTSVLTTSPASFAAPVTSVLSGLGNISGDSVTIRVNGSISGTPSTSDQGTGNYGNYPLYIGARAGSSLWFNGRLYGMVVAGKSTSTSEITNTENYLNQKTGAY